MRKQFVLLFPSDTFDTNVLDGKSDKELIDIHASIDEKVYNNITSRLPVDVFFDMLNVSKPFEEVWGDHFLFYLVEEE